MIDTSNPNKGHYLYERQRLAAQAEKLGIDFRETGTIIDSPNGIQFFDRMIPLPEQFQAMAFIEGLKAEVIAERDYRDPAGKINTNLYLKLTKSRKQPNMHQVLAATRNLYTSQVSQYASRV